jgi:hypothetical protein
VNVGARPAPAADIVELDGAEFRRRDDASPWIRIDDDRRGPGSGPTLH